MNTDRKKVMIILLLIILMEIPVFLLFGHFLRDDAPVETTVAAVTEAPTETTVASIATEPPEEPPAPTETTVPETEPPKVTIDAVPQYYQNDYPDEPYASGTVASSGSSMTALAMVASYMTDHVFYPDQIADYLAHFLGGNHQRLEYGNDLLQLSCRRAGNIHEATQAVKDGKVVILMLNPENFLTWKEHYLVLTGVDDAGYYTVLDTDSSHREKKWLKRYYEEGFRWDDFLRGYACAWIYDKSAMPEEPFVYQPEPPAPTPRYPELTLTAEEKLLIADLICMEAGGEPFEGQQAVAEVIINRLASGDFQSSIYNIVHAEDQFAAATRLDQAKPDYSQFKAIEQALYGPYVLPEDVVFFATYKVNDHFWGQIGNHYFCHGY